MLDESHTTAWTPREYLLAIERTMAAVLLQFRELPDRFFQSEDLYGALILAAQAESGLTRLYATRDGHRTVLLHRDLPGYRADGRHPLALLNPNFVRGHDLPVVANLDDQGRRAVADEPPREDAQPLLASVTLCLVEDLSDATVARIAARLAEIEALKPDAMQRYMAIYCRHWDLDAHIRRAMPRLEGIAGDYPQIPVAVVQSAYDDVGHVFGGRYLNIWLHMAPLPPL
jgi:hypothetical protein